MCKKLKFCIQPSLVQEAVAFSRVALRGKCCVIECLADFGSGRVCVWLSCRRDTHTPLYENYSTDHNRSMRMCAFWSHAHNVCHLRASQACDSCRFLTGLSIQSFSKKFIFSSLTGFVLFRLSGRTCSAY